MFCPECGKELNKGKFCPECGTKIENKSSNNGNMITLTVTRKKRVIGCAIPFSVYVDDVKIGNLGNGKSLTCEVGEGVHTVMFKCVEKNVTQEVNVTSETNSVEVTCRATMGLAAAVAQVLDVKYN